MRWLLGLALTLAVLLVVAAFAVPLLVDTPRVQGLIAANVSRALGRPAKFASVSVALFPLPAVELRRLEVAEDPAFGTAPFLNLETGRLRLRLRPLLSGRVEFGELILDRPAVALVQSADRRWNIASLGSGGGEAPAPARPGRGGGSGGPAVSGAPALGSRISIKGGVVTYASQATPASAARWRLEDVDLTIVNDGPVFGFEGGLRLVPGDVVATIRDGRLALDGRSLLEAPLSARVTLAAKDLGELLGAAAAPRAPAVAGPLRGTLAVTGTLGMPRATGDLELTSLRLTQVSDACPEPKRRTLVLDDLKVAAAWQDARFTGRPVATRLGGGTLTANVTATLERGGRVQVTDLTIKGVPLERVLVDFLCQGYAVAGPLDLTGALAFGAADPKGTLSGPGQLRLGPGRVVGAQALQLMDGVMRVGGAVSSLLSADLPASPFASPLEFESITGTYQITDGVLTTRDLVYTSRAMKVAVAGDYGLATGRMNLTLLVTHGRGELKAIVTGTAVAPSIRVVPATLLRDVDPKKVESGLQQLLRRFRR